jgi:hypothetical protein
VKLVELLGIKTGNILKEKILSLKKTVKTKISETYTEAEINLRRVTNLALTQ